MREAVSRQPSAVSQGTGSGGRRGAAGRRARRPALLGVGIAAVLACGVPSAAEPQAPDRMPAYEEPRGGLAAGASDGLLSTSVRTAGSLGLVLAVIGLGVVAVRRLGLRGRWTGQASDGPRVLARTYLGPKESLCVVRVGAEVLLLGVSSQQISLLCKLEPTAPPARAGAGPEEAGLFQRHLRQMAGQGEGPADVPALEGRLQRIRTAWGLGKE